VYFIMFATIPILGAAAPNGILPSTETPHPTSGPSVRVNEVAGVISERVRLTSIPDDFTPMRVLVVDDHVDAADALAAVIELLGCPVQVCNSGVSALTAAESFNPQVCLIDLMMPGMDGLELAARLKDRAGSRPLLLVASTALGDWEIRTRTAIAGFHAHLTKPVAVTILIDTLTRLGRIIA
jgi:CheY-like chemotaxis protein